MKSDSLHRTYTITELIACNMSLSQMERENTKVGEMVKKLSDFLVEIGRDDNMVEKPVHIRRLSILLCDVEEYRLDRITLINENDTTRLQVRNGVAGLLIGCLATIMWLTFLGVSPVVLGTGLSFVPLIGAACFFSVTSPLPDAHLYETLEKAIIYKKYINLLLLLLRLEETNERITGLCDTLAFVLITGQKKPIKEKSV